MLVVHNGQCGNEERRKAVSLIFEQQNNCQADQENDLVLFYGPERQVRRIKLPRLWRIYAKDRDPILGNYSGSRVFKRNGFEFGLNFWFDTAFFRILKDLCGETVKFLRLWGLKVFFNRAGTNLKFLG